MSGGSGQSRRLLGGAGELGDAAARKAVSEELHTTLFVDAGAGSGKTTALVSRIVQLVLTGLCDIEELAAITFTEAAALELRVRVRRAFEEVAQGAASAAPTAVAAASAALEALDGAAITTIHGFCYRLLASYPVEAGLPPRIEVLDEVARSIDWKRRWNELLDELGREVTTRALFGYASLLGVTPKHLDDIARDVDAEWDRGALLAPDPGGALGRAEVAVKFGAAEVARHLDQALAYEHQCSDPADALFSVLGEAKRLRQALGAIESPAGSDSDGTAATDALALLATGRPVLRVTRTGQSGSWGCDIDEVRRHLLAADASRAEMRQAVIDAVLPEIAGRFGVASRKAARERAASGQLVFHDLLVFTRDLLAVHDDVRSAVQARYRFVLVDEFQDTDPLQLEIAELMGASQPEGGIEPGRLFAVGDRQQAIYRFRGADLASYETARRRYASGGEVVLSSNFRSAPAVLAFANACFHSLMGESFMALEPVRPAGPTAVPVRICGGPLDFGLRRHEQRVLEADSIAGVIDGAVRREGWLVCEEGTGAPSAGAGGPESFRPARFADVAILVPRRTGLAEIEAGLDRLGIGYRVESASLVYRTQEVRDLLSLCRAIDDPGDQVALVATLRSPAFGCSDADLFAYRRAGGAWCLDSVVAPGAISAAGAPNGGRAPHGDASVVAAAMETLNAYRDERFELGPLGALEDAVRDRRLMHLAAASPKARESWRRVRFLIERARAFVAAGGGGLKEFADWVDEQLSEGLRSVESVLPEPDEDVVHILTVHAAKGLEFPVTVLAGFGTSDVVPRSGRKVLRHDNGDIEVHLRGDLRTAGFSALSEAEVALDRDEAVRVLYVAATRARDHLVVCGHHVPAAQSYQRTLGQRLYEAAVEARALAPNLWREHPPSGVDQGALFDLASLGGGTAVAPAGEPHPAPESVMTPSAWRAWQEERAALLAGLGAKKRVRATDVAVSGPLSGRPILAVDTARGRFGSAVHAVLQTVPAVTAKAVGRGESPPEFETLARACAAAERIAGEAPAVEQAARSVLESPVVAAGFLAGPRREVYVATTIGGVLLDGYADLCYRHEGGVVVVDYKTGTPADRPEGISDAHRMQAAAYALALQDATGLEVTGCALVFARRDGKPAVEHPLEDLPRVLDEVRARVAGP